MNRYIFADHMLQRALNVLFCFVLFALLTEIVLKLFKIRSPRLRASLRLLPSFRLILEPLFWIFPVNWPFLNISVFSCSHPLQHFLLKLLSAAEQARMSQHGLWTLTGSLLLHLPAFAVYTGLFSALAFSLYRASGCFLHYIRSAVSIKQMGQRGVVNR
jgi:hypothetical protein